jgi:hypothetical protein
VTVQVALVPLKAIEPEPHVIMDTPSLKVIVSVDNGVPAPGAVTPTPAVYVTVWPATEGLEFDVTTVTVEAMLTVWVSADEVDPL